MQSRVIAELLTLNMFGSSADGAAAAVVHMEEIAKKDTHKPPVEIAACVLGSGVYRKEKRGEQGIHTGARLIDEGQTRI